jgi:two-component sensor histidine kinase
MQKAGIVILAVLLWIANGHAQNDEKALIDSLNREAWQAIGTDPGYAHAMATSAFTRASAIGYEDGIALAYNRFGKIHFTGGNLDSALFYYRLNLNLRIKQKNRSGIANTFLNMGDVSTQKGDGIAGLKYYQAAHHLFALLNDSPNIAITCLKKGILFNEQLKYKEAENSLISGLSIAERLENFEYGIAALSAELGNLYSTTNKTRKALQYYQTAILIYSEMDDVKNLSNVYTGLGNVYANMLAYDKAYQAYSKSLAAYRESGGGPGEALRIYNIGTVLYEQKKNKECVHYFERALHLANSSDIYLTQKTLFALSNAYFDLKQYENAFFSDTRYDSITNMLFNAEKEKQISELEIQYQVKEKQNEIQLLKTTEALQQKTIEQKTQERNAWLAGSLLLLLVVSVTYIAYRQKKRANAVLTIQKNTIEQQHREKELLLREIHHRVKNNLQVVSSILSLQSYKITDKNVSLAMKESRARVEAMSMIHRELYRDEKLTHINLPSYLKKLMDHVSESYGFEETNLTTHIQVEVEEVDVETAIPLGLIVNEVMSNSFKHAFSDQPQPYVGLTLQRENDSLLLILKDNGKGFGEVPSGNSFGMELVQSLTKQLKGSFTIDHSAGTAYTFILHEHKRWKT